MKDRINITIDDDVKAVFDRTKGLAKNSTYANFILRDYFFRQGLLPAVDGLFIKKVDNYGKNAIVSEQPNCIYMTQGV